MQNEKPPNLNEKGAILYTLNCLSAALATYDRAGPSGHYVQLRGLYFEFGSLHRLSCSGDLRLEDGVAEVLPIAVAAASLVEVEVVYFSNCRVLQAGNGWERSILCLH